MLLISTAYVGMARRTCRYSQVIHSRCIENDTQAGKLASWQAGSFSATLPKGQLVG